MEGLLELPCRRGTRRALVAQQRLRRHQDQRLAERAVHLPAQHVEIIGRRGGHADLHIVLRAKLQIALQPRRGMFRPLALIAMRQKHHEARHAQPFHFAGGDELVDDHLRAIGEIAELRFPQHQRFGLGGGVAIFEAQHRFFRQKRVHHFEFALAFADMVERQIAFFGFLIDQGGMALARRCRARRPGPTGAHPCLRPASVPKASASAVAQSKPFAGLEHLRLGFELARDGLVQMEALRRGGQRLADLLQHIVRHAGLAAAVAALGRGGKTRPAPVQPVGAVGQMRFGGVEFLVQPLVEAPTASPRYRPR